MNPDRRRLLAVPIACVIAAAAAIASAAAPRQAGQPRLVVFEAFNAPG